MKKSSSNCPGPAWSYGVPHGSKDGDRRQQPPTLSKFNMQDLSSFLNDVLPEPVLQQECVSGLDPHVSFDMDFLAASLGAGQGMSPARLCYNDEGGTYCKDSDEAASGIVASAGWDTGYVGMDGVRGHMGMAATTAPQEEDYLSLGATDPNMVLNTQDRGQSWLGEDSLVLPQDQFFSQEAPHFYEENSVVLPPNPRLIPEYSSTTLQNLPGLSSLSVHNLTSSVGGMSGSYSSDIPGAVHSIYPTGDLLTTVQGTCPLEGAANYPSGSAMSSTAHLLPASRKGYKHRHSRVYLTDPEEKKTRTRELNNESSKLHRGNKKKDNMNKQLLEKQLAEDHKQLTQNCQQLEDHLHWCRQMYTEHFNENLPNIQFQ